MLAFLKNPNIRKRCLSVDGRLQWREKISVSKNIRIRVEGGLCSLRKISLQSSSFVYLKCLVFNWRFLVQVLGTVNFP